MQSVGAGFKDIEGLNALVMYGLLRFRCSDGMDRHRQEWLNYACSEEVPLDIMNEFQLHSPFFFLRPSHLLYSLWAEQKCNL